VLSELSRSGAGGLADEIPRSVLLDAPSGIMLTTRERVVLAELPRCASTRELATQLGVSPNTVKTQLRGLYRKLGAANREDAIAIAIHRHLLVQVPVSSDLDRR
jgi:LuxR family maltose regulon positive regulatory protein